VSAVSAPVSCVPLTVSVPDHAPEAVHAVALVEDQVIVVLPPLATMLGTEVIVTVGAVVLAPAAEAVVLGCAAVVEEVLAWPFVLVVPTEPQADNPKVMNANTTDKSR
jgi:hypothetical protein